MELNDLQWTKKGLALIISIGRLFPQPPRSKQSTAGMKSFALLATLPLFDCWVGLL